MVHLSSRSPMWSSAMTTHVCTAVELLTREIRERRRRWEDGEERRGRWRWEEEEEEEMQGRRRRGEVRGELWVQHWGGEVWCSGEVRGEVRKKGVGKKRWEERGEVGERWRKCERMKTGHWILNRLFTTHYNATVSRNKDILKFFCQQLGYKFSSEVSINGGQQYQHHINGIYW